MANRNRIEKIAKKEREKLLNARSKVEKTASRPMAMQPIREVDSGGATYSATDAELPSKVIR